MSHDMTTTSLVEAAKLLTVAPTPYNHFIHIVDGQESWQEHQKLLDDALTLLTNDEPYSLRHMAPPPLWTESNNEAGRVWRAANPQHPMADDVRATERREAGCEILTWAHYVPQAFSKDRRGALCRCLVDCDVGIRFDLIRAVGFLGSRDAVESLTEVDTLESESPNCKAMAQVLIQRLTTSNTKGENIMDEITATAFHEAAHVIALLESGCQVTRVCINDDGSGATSTPNLPANDEDLVRVALSGMEAENHSGGNTMTFDAFAAAYASASGDRDLIEEETRTAWLAHDINWHIVQYDRARAFVERHEARIRAIAEGILAKATFPKCLSESEIAALINA